MVKNAVHAILLDCCSKASTWPGIVICNFERAFVVNVIIFFTRHCRRLHGAIERKLRNNVQGWMALNVQVNQSDERTKGWNIGISCWSLRESDSGNLEGYWKETVLQVLAVQVDTSFFLKKADPIYVRPEHRKILASVLGLRRLKMDKVGHAVTCCPHCPVFLSGIFYSKPPITIIGLGLKSISDKVFLKFFQKSQKSLGQGTVLFASGPSNPPKLAEHIWELQPYTEKILLVPVCSIKCSIHTGKLSCIPNVSLFLMEICLSP